MIPAETINAIASLAVKANPRIIKADGEPPHVYYVVKQDGELERVTATTGPDAHTASDLNTLCRLCHAMTEAAPEIWYSRLGVVAVLEPHEDHRSTCKLQLTPSPQLKRLIEWDGVGRHTLSQGEFILALRTLFAGCAPDMLLPAVRQVKTSKAADVNSKIEQGKVSLGKSMIAEMTGVAAIPEEVPFVVPVFAQAAVPVMAKLRVAIDPDPQTERFTLIVLPGDVEAALAYGEERLAVMLTEELGQLFSKGSPVPIYRGSP
jgi:hypothetical protein